MAEVIRRLLPNVVHVAELRDDTDDETLLPEELAHVARAVVERRREFATVRRCARVALRELGLDRPPLLPGRAGAPSWPEGVVGSMTHCRGYRAAAVARSTYIVGLGIDAEPDEPLPDGVLDRVSSAAERGHLARLAATGPAGHWDRLLFSAKESVYKAWYPLTRRWLDFQEAVVEFEVDGTFRAHLGPPGPVVAGHEVQLFTGAWSMGDGLVVSAVVVPRGTASEHG